MSVALMVDELVVNLVVHLVDVLVVQRVAWMESFIKNKTHGIK